MLHVPGMLAIPGTHWTLFVLYVLIPWVGVMATGYAFGAILRLQAAERQRIIFRIGAAATAGFVLLRASGVYGNLADGLPFGIPISQGPWQTLP